VGKPAIEQLVRRAFRGHPLRHCLFQHRSAFVLVHFAVRPYDLDERDQGQSRQGFRPHMHVDQSFQNRLVGDPRDLGKTLLAFGHLAHVGQAFDEGSILLKEERILE
jgi:hypothetical protein